MPWTVTDSQSIELRRGHPVLGGRFFGNSKKTRRPLEGGLSMERLGGIRPAAPLPCRYSLLGSLRWLFMSVIILVVSSSPSSAQQTMDACTTSPNRVENLAEAKALSAAANCTDRGELSVVWVGSVTLDTAISVGSGTVLSITGEDGQVAEAAGGSATRLFDLSPGAKLTLTRMKLSGGSTSSNGGAIRVDMAALTLHNCVFEGNVATGGSGGAVWAEGGQLEINGGEFLNNSASISGGAVLAMDAGVVIQDGTLFQRNKALLDGGALFCGGKDPRPALPVSCTLDNATFISNNAASREEFVHVLMSWYGLKGGGAAAFVHAAVNLTECAFKDNFAQIAGGALYGRNETFMVVEGCTFEENETLGHGGAVVTSSATIGGNTLFRNNSATKNGGGVLGWDPDGSIELNDVVCTENWATRYGGCFYANGELVVNNGTLMQGNVGFRGGCIYASAGSMVEVLGGEFTCQSTNNGGFMFASGGAVVTIKDGLFSDNVAEDRAGVVYCSGNSDDAGPSAVTIEGGTFINNQAHELGGAISAWGDTTVVTLTGGLFRNNTAKFYGGFIFLEEGASSVCEGAMIQENYAGDQGGAIYARDGTFVNSSCDLIGNESPQGAALYLTYVMSANFENNTVRNNVASGGSVVFAAHASVVASGLTFSSGVGLLEQSSNRAIQLENARLVAKRCVFDGWLGDTVVHSVNELDGSLVLENCDFRGSSPAMAVLSPYADAYVRNAVISNHTLATVIASNSQLSLVDQALNCSSANACGPGACLDSALGVLCECLEDGACLDGGGALSLEVQKAPNDVTYSPNMVSFELMISAAVDGTTDAIWDLAFEAEELNLKVVPSNGILPPGSSITVAVTGSALNDDVGGNLSSHFVVTSVSSDTLNSTTGVKLEVLSPFYLCQAFEYARPSDDEHESVWCDQCVNIEGTEGVDCDVPGATLALLPIMKGYWRSSEESLVVLSCLNPDACMGITEVSGSNDYCAHGYEGPYCAVCSDGFGKGAGASCYTCDDTKAHFLITVGAIFSVVILLFLFVVVVFLIGGLDAVEDVRQAFSLHLGVSESRGFPAAHASPRRNNVLSRSLSDTQSNDFPISPAPNSSPVKNNEGAENLDETRVNRLSPPVPFPDLRLDPEATPSSQDAVVQQRFRLPEATQATPSRPETNLAAGRNVQSSVLGSGIGDSSQDSGGKKAKCCGLGDKIKSWMKRLPWNKLKILVVVWQILTVFPSITAIKFPPAYSRFLSWIEVINLELGHIFSASCLLPTINFYKSLLATTLTPIGLGMVLVVTYRMAKSRGGIGTAGVIAKRAAWSRHMAAGLLLTFLVFTSASTMVFKTFACDYDVVEGESYLRADYSLSCKSDVHKLFRVYAIIMILVYPIGIPLLYGFILWTNRELLNPQVHAPPANQLDASDRTRLSAVSSGAPEIQAKKEISPQECEELENLVKKRKEHPALMPSMFLWKDFGPDLYFYEVVECGRRILLTGVLIFIAPNSSAQAAMACIFAFVSLLGFELMRPHLDPADSWLYRLGCVVIFLSNFLALLIKVDAAGESNRNHLGVLMVAINIVLVVAVLWTSWFATQQSVDDSGDEDNALATARSMVVSERVATNNARKVRENKLAAGPDLNRRSKGKLVQEELLGVHESKAGRAEAGVAGGDRVRHVEKSRSKGRNIGAATEKTMWHRDQQLQSLFV